MNIYPMKSYTPMEWHKFIVESVEKKLSIGELIFPEFPSEAIIKQFNGTSSRGSLEHAFNVYLHFLEKSRKFPIIKNSSTFLDFGCGWGRFIRYFLRDFTPSKIYGVDVDNKVLDICSQTRVQGYLSKLEILGSIPIAANSVTHCLSNSVFTHIPANHANHWLKEINLTLAENALFVCTVLTEKHLEFFLKKFDNTVDLTSLRQKFENEGILYLNSGGGGPNRTQDEYGWTVMTKNYINNNWNKLFDIVDICEKSGPQTIVTMSPKK